MLLPAVQVTVTLTPCARVWADVQRPRPPILAIETATAEVCLVLPADLVTAADVDTAHQLAVASTAFAEDVRRRQAS